MSDKEHSSPESSPRLFGGITPFSRRSEKDDDDEEDGPKIYEKINLPEAEMPSNRPLKDSYLLDLFTVQMGFNQEYVSTERKSGDTLYFKDPKKFVFNSSQELDMFAHLSEGWGILPAEARVTKAEVVVKGGDIQDIPTSTPGKSHAQVTSYSFEVRVHFELNPNDFPLLKEGNQRYKDAHRPKNRVLRLVSLAAEKFNIPWLFDDRVKMDPFDHFENAVEMTFHYKIQPPSRTQQRYTHSGTLFEMKAQTTPPQRNIAESFVKSMTTYGWDDTEETEAFRKKLTEEVHSLDGVWEDWSRNIRKLNSKKENELRGRGQSDEIRIDESSLNWDTTIVKLLAEKTRQILIQQPNTVTTPELPSSST